VAPGLHAIEAVVQTPNPELWWPLGHGKPHLYTLRSSISDGDTLVDERTTRIGFRRVRGDAERLEVNNKKVFLKCACWRPPDVAFLREVKREIVHTVRRLAAHPSVVQYGAAGALTGEALAGAEDPPVGAPAALHDFWSDALPKILRREDPTRALYSPPHAGGN